MRCDGGFLQRADQGSARPRVKAGPGVTYTKHPAVGVILLAIAPIDRNSAGARVFESVDQQVLSNTANLDGVALDDQRVGTARFQIQAALLRLRMHFLAQFAQQARHVELFRFKMFVARLQTSQIHHVVQHHVQR